jgi:uncharacterized protein YjiK
MRPRAGSVAICLMAALGAVPTATVPPLAGQDTASVDVPPAAERWDLHRPKAHYKLPGRLREISGLAFDTHGQLLAHDDNKGVVYHIDPRTGEADHGFALGSVHRPPKRDFEAIAVVGHRLFLVTSQGLLYEFREAPEGGSAAYRVSDTGLGRHCEIEGMTYDARSQSLLFACKRIGPSAREIHIYSLSVDPTRTVPHLLTVPFAALAPFGLGGGVHPSGIEVEPESGALLLVAARERAFLVLSRNGRVLGAAHLSSRYHRQPEGVAIGPGGDLYISDEAAGHHPTLTVYAPRTPEP